jgi:hypothetical protein
MMTEAETEELVYETVAEVARRFLKTDREGDPVLPPGSIEDAVHGHIVYIGRMALIFEEALRVMIPYAYDPGAETETLPVLEGVIVDAEEG